MIHTIRPNEGIELILFPDNQPQVRVDNWAQGLDIRVVFPVQTSVQLLQLAMVADALTRLKAVKKELVIPYLMGARSDRLMVSGESIGLEVIAEIINRCEFETVKLFDVHSEVALLLIDNSENILPYKLLHRYMKEDVVLILPDAGALKRVDYYMRACPSITEVVHCIKKRDLRTGAIELKVLEPEKCQDRNCVIIDDICDGGATFLAISDQLPRLATEGLESSLTLIVSHGIFSKGTRKLTDAFDWIITSDSYQSGSPIEHPRITIVPLEL